MNHVAEYITDKERLDGIRYGAAMGLSDAEVEAMLRYGETGHTEAAE